MAKEIREYMDIGHNDPLDSIWLFNRATFTVEILRAAGGRSHEQEWGLSECENTWRGRYEVKTGYLSIAPPLSGKLFKRPPQALLDLLKIRFSVVRFFFFTGGAPEGFSPNPRND